MKRILRLICPVLFVTAIILSSSSGFAQDYPNKAIRFVVGFVPGGGTDYLARTSGQKLSESLGQPVVIDNRPGAGSNTAAEIVAKASPDGYTLLMANISLSMSVSLYGNLHYDLLKDLSPVTMVATGPQILVVNPSLPVVSVKELIALAKSKPGKIKFGSAGNGSPAHLAAEMFKKMAGVDMLHIPYKGGSQAITALLSGEVTVLFAGSSESLPHIKAGKLRAIAATTLKRASMVPDLPTIIESGVPGYEFITWFGVFVPSGTSLKIVNRLNSNFVKILRIPDLKERFSNQGFEPISSTPEEFGAFIKGDIAKWAKVVKESGARVD